MIRKLRDARYAPIAVVSAVAIVVVLIPMCMMALCGPVGDGHHMGMSGLASLVNCDHMYFPSDAASGVLAQFLVMMFAVAVFAAYFMAPAMAQRPSWTLVTVDEPPRPPDDPLRGRLLI